MSGMGDDFNDSPESGAVPAHPAEQHAQYRAACAELMRQRDAVISSAAVRAMQDAARMFDATAGHPLSDAFAGAMAALDAPASPLLRDLGDAVQLAQEALAVNHPAGEPVAWMFTSDDGRQWFAGQNDVRPTDSSIPLYTAPPAAARVQLTDEQIQAIWNQECSAQPGWARHIAYARAIERAHGITGGAA